MESPITKKLPPLDDNLLPDAEFLKSVCRSLDSEVERIVREKIPIDTIWTSVGKLEFRDLSVDIVSGIIQQKPF